MQSKIDCSLFGTGTRVELQDAKCVGSGGICTQQAGVSQASGRVKTHDKNKGRRTNKAGAIRKSFTVRLRRLEALNLLKQQQLQYHSEHLVSMGDTVLL